MASTTAVPVLEQNQLLRTLVVDEVCTNQRNAALACKLS